MGKYTIETDGNTADDIGSYLGIRIEICNKRTWVKTDIELTPYTESDMEKVREEAFKNGYDAACKDIDIKSKTNAAYRKGLEDAWETAKKIALDKEDGGLDTVAYCEIFGYGKGFGTVLKTFTASEAIEKIRQYEQEKEEIQVGDEVEIKCGVSPAIYMQGTNGADEIYLLFNDGSCGVHSRSEIECKTGRHFPEIAEVLAKMKETDNG